MFSNLQLWPRFVVFPIIALGGQLAMMYHWPDLSLAAKIISIILLTPAWYCISGCLHEMGHMTFLASDTVSRRLGRFLGMILVIPFTCFRATHLTHHAKMCTSEDYELWPYCKPNYSIRFRKAFCLFDLLLGTISAPIIYSRVFWKRNSPLSQSEISAIKFEYLLSILFWGAIAFVVLYVSVTQIATPAQLSIWWIAPLAFAATLNTFRKLIEHVGLSSCDPLFGTRTVQPTNIIAKFISFGNFDLNLHGPHHRFGMAQHDELSDKLDQALHKQPAIGELVFHSYSGAAWHTLKCILKNPGVGEASVRDVTHEERVDEDRSNQS